MPKKKVITGKNAKVAERLRMLRDMARLKRNEIEAQYGLPEATLKLWESGRAILTDKGIQRCIDTYRKAGIVLTREWLLEGKGLPPKISVMLGQYFASEQQYPLRPSQSAVLQVKELDHAPAYLRDDNMAMLQEANYFKELYADAVIYMVADDDMSPVYQPGDYVGGRFRYGSDIAKVVKKDCIVRLKNQKQLLLRRVFKSPKGKGYNLACINPMPTAEVPILFNVEIEAAAPVIWHRIPNV